MYSVTVWCFLFTFSGRDPGAAGAPHSGQRDSRVSVDSATLSGRDVERRPSDVWTRRRIFVCRADSHRCGCYASLSTQKVVLSIKDINIPCPPRPGPGVGRPQLLTLRTETHSLPLLTYAGRLGDLLARVSNLDSARDRTTSRVPYWSTTPYLGPSPGPKSSGRRLGASLPG